MDNDTRVTQPNSDMEQIKNDFKGLYEHVGSALGKKTEEAKVRWNETRNMLEAKKTILEERASELAKAGSAASNEMKSGFSSALAELKKAFTEAKAKFDGE
jgi:ElaB/YqjD/DUF883 family membrane-anchored ribosome-binding protein